MTRPQTEALLQTLLSNYLLKPFVFILLQKWQQIYGFICKKDKIQVNKKGPYP
jgi:hypothetical protein